MKFLLALGLSIAAAVATPALAAVAVFSGDTTGGLTYNRPLSGVPPQGLSNVGTAVRYKVTDFTVDVSGNYTLVDSAIYDAYLGVYSNAFNPGSPLVNALAYNDDGGPGSDAQITSLGLLSGVSYFAVSSGFANTDFGRFTLTITGPGLASGGAVPEPATWALMIGGFGLTGAMLRRREAVRA